MVVPRLSVTFLCVIMSRGKIVRALPVSRLTKLLLRVGLRRKTIRAPIPVVPVIPIVLR